MSDDPTPDPGANAPVTEAVAPDSGPVPDDRPRQRGVRAALVSLSPPEVSPRFWVDIERGLEDQGQLDIVTRPAVRAITEPPPISQPTLDDDPRHALAAYRPSGMPRLEPSSRRPADEDEARRRRLMAVGVLVAVLSILGVASVLGGGDPPPPATSTTLPGGAAPVAPGQQAAPPTPPPVPGLDPSMPLTSAGLGPLYIGMTLGELHDSGAVTTLDQPTFDASGGSCFDIRLPGAADLTLRFRSPDPDLGVADPREGILASVNIDAATGSSRLTDTGVGLGATEEQVGAVYPGTLRVSDRPDLSGGRIYLDRAGDGTGIAYITDGYQVTEISVGEVDVIRLRQACY